MRSFFLGLCPHFPPKGGLIQLAIAVPAHAALRVIYTGTDKEYGVSESLRGGIELVVADATTVKLLTV